MTTNIHGMAITMLAIARHHVHLSQAEIDRIVELAERTDARKPGLTDRNMERLRQFLDPRNVTMLLGLPSRLQCEAERRGKPDEKAAVLMQSAVAIELLLMTMLRRKNLVRLSEAVHVKWSQAGRKGICHIAIEGHEVKNREALHFELPPRSAGLLRVYMERYQPLLGTQPSSWLFPGRYGDAPKNASGFSVQIADTVFALTGIRMHVHMFRHTGALLYLQRNPGGYEVLKRVFGHRSMETTASIYCGLEMLSSAKHFDEEILAHDDTPRRRSQRTRTAAKRVKRKSVA